MKRACLGCRALIPQGSRCADCQRVVEQAKTARRPTRRWAAETRRRRLAVAEHVADRGWVCPGWSDRPAHYSSDLTADHDPPVAVQVARGIPVEVAEAGPLVVRCRPCNSRRGAH